MATMVMKAYAYVTGENIDAIVTTAEVRFTDQGEASDWARRNIILANAMGFINGFPNRVFRPKLNVTRAEGAVVIKNMQIFFQV